MISGGCIEVIRRASRKLLGKVSEICLGNDCELSGSCLKEVKKVS